MTGTEAEQLWGYQVQLRRTAAGREEDAEEQIRRAYQQILQKLLSILGKYYAAYGNAEDGAMTQGDLRAAGQYKNFLQDVVDNLVGIAEPVDKQIRQTIEDTYTACYDGMVNAVKQSTAGNISLQSALSGLSACTPETVKHIVENPMDKLKLSTVLNRRRSQIVTSAKKTLAIGLASGDSYTRMAQRIAETLNGDYKKAMRIVRTEANRAINRGFQDVTEEAAELLLNSEYVEVKEWCSMEDDSVRDTHRHLNGKKIHALDVFHSGGAAADCPGGFGVAGEDINCRCFLKYSFMLRSEFLAQGGVIPGTAKENAELEQTEKTPEQQLQPESESTPQPSPVNASSVGHSVEVDVKTPKDNGGTGKTYQPEKIPGKSLTSGGKGGILNDISSGIKVKTEYFDGELKYYDITQERIQGVPPVEINGFTKQKEKSLTDFCKKLLEYMQDSETGTEGVLVLDANLKEIDRYKGEPGKPRVPLKKYNHPYFILHNHPDGLPFSEIDLLQFIRHENMIGLAAVGNDGTPYFLYKTKDYDAEVFDEYVNSIRMDHLIKMTPEDHIRFSEEVIANAEDNGVAVFNGKDKKTNPAI